MELHEQQQRRLEPDVVPTPYSTDSSEAAVSSNDDNPSDYVEDEQHTHEMRTAPVKDMATSKMSPIREEYIRRKTDMQVAMRSPPRMESSESEEIVVERPVCAPSYNFGQYPMTLTCPCCDYAILTYVQYDVSMKQYMICVLLCVCFLWPCSLIPCLFRGMYDVYHFCPVCRQMIGIYKA